MGGHVVAVHASSDYTFSKATLDAIEVVAGMGVVGDAHYGATVQHRGRVSADPNQPNLRQVHLLAGELLDELTAAGYTVGPGDLGENVTTAGVELLALPTGALLRMGGALLGVTGLRNPCAQIEQFHRGLLGEVLARDAAGRMVRRAGVMAVVLEGGRIAPGDPIAVALPPAPHTPLTRV
jgi:MOSC domain-containing protein YiiM